MPGVSWDYLLQEPPSLKTKRAKTSYSRKVKDALEVAACLVVVPPLFIGAAIAEYALDLHDEIKLRVERDQKAQWGVPRDKIEAADKKGREERARYREYYQGARIGGLA